MSERPAVDTVAFFEGLAAEMNAQPERYEVLGDCDLVLGLVMARADGEPFRLQVTFEGVSCLDVSPMEAGDETLCDCWLEGPLTAWAAMVDDIATNGQTTDHHTLNSLTLLGDEIVLRSSDVMGIDKFSQFNQSLQEFFDRAARTPALRAAD